MTKFRGTTSGVTIITRCNIDNVTVGNKIKVGDNDGNKIVGIVADVFHLVNKGEDYQGLERTIHSIIIDIDDKEE